MSLGEDPSVEHGILAAEDLRWLPKQRSQEIRYPQTCWNPDVTEKRRPVLTSCAQDEVDTCNSPGSSGKTRTGRGACKHTDSARTRRVSQSEAVGN